MEYISTRNNSDHFSFKNVFLKGLADDGGLFVPKSIKPFSKDELNKLSGLNYNELAAEIIFPFIGDFMTKEELISTLLNGFTDFGINRPPSSAKPFKKMSLKVKIF